LRDLRIEKAQRSIELKQKHDQSAKSQQLPVVGMIGAGNFTGQVLLPALQKTGVRFKSIASSGGVSGTHLGKKFGFEESTTEVDTIFGDPEINTVFITTRHDSHARFVIQALNTGKHVFVEKPLCLTIQEREEVRLAADPRGRAKTFQPDNLSGGNSSSFSRSKKSLDNATSVESTMPIRLLHNCSRGESVERR